MIRKDKPLLLLSHHSSLTTHHYSSATRAAATPRPPEATVRAAGIVALTVAAAAGVAWWLVLALAARLDGARARRAVAIGAVVVPLVLLVPIAARVDDPAGQVRAQYRAFVDLRVNETAENRFTDAGGYRYDLWRVAWRYMRS